MEFLQQNKIFAAIAGLALLALLVLWPSLFGLGPTIVSLDRARYERAMMDHRSLQGKMDQYLPKSGKGVPIKRAAQEVEASNRLLTQNLDELRSWMAFVPRYPFRIPELRQADEDRKSYVSLAYTYARTGQIKCPEYTIDNYNDGVVFLASQRNIPVRDTFFGMSEMSTPQAIKDPDVRIAQIALVHELGHLAIRLHVDEVASIIPAEPYKVRLHDTDLALAYPVAIRFRCDLPTLLTFLHALDGAHGQVAAVAGGPEAPVAPNKPEADEPAHEAIKPLLPQPKAKADGDEPEDPGPPPAAPAAAKDAPAQQKLVIHLVGSPSYLAPEPNDGALKERFTLFRREEGNPQKFQFIANAIATKVLDPGDPTFTPASILNWRGLCRKLKAQSAEREPNVGKRLWGFLAPEAHKAIQEIAEGKDATEAHQTDILASLNRMLTARRDFYRPEDFAGVTLANEAEGLLKLDRQAMPEATIRKLNRRLLEAAYPDEIAKAAIKLEATVQEGSDLHLLPDGRKRRLVRPNDFASTRYFFIRSLKLKAAPGTVARDSDGFPSDVTPPHLEVDLAVAALSLLEVQAAAPVEKRPAAREAIVVPRGF
ncbi:MAG TPA: hypothetical protein PLE19_00545 [Planctomycetota bacterium]|nr:hypothetical protein [Planctomycetota bacterium]HRR79249.1 hypothetical protein [Planctomycetota bacterium]